MSEYPSGAIKTAVLYFLPELIRATGENIEYLMPFLVQDTGFPRVIPASTGIPAQVFELMKRTRAELPVISGRGGLSARRAALDTPTPSSRALASKPNASIGPSGAALSKPIDHMYV